MEGPSLVIAREEFAPFQGKKVSQVEGKTRIPKENFEGATFKEARSWGKHFLLTFETGRGKSKKDFHIRIHFLMFGSYRIDNPRENRIPMLAYTINERRFYFYSCGIRTLEPAKFKAYDWSIDLMSPKWDHKQAVEHVKSKPETMACDILMDQNIFAGLGNIIKNEVLYRVRLHPEMKIKDLSSKQVRDLVYESHNYSHQFYEWKKINQLKRHWLIMRKKDCPEKHGELIKEPTGKLQRLSHYCPVCQPFTGSKKKPLKKSKVLKRKAPAKKPERSITH